MDKKFQRALAVIPARGGSKRIVGKNLRILHDRPLVCHTIDAAIASGCFDTIILSSDDDEILALADDYEEVTPVKREPEFAGDHSTVFSFLHHFSNQSSFAGSHDAIALLLPTAPFRTKETIRKVAQALSVEVDSVITVNPYGFPVQFAVTISEDDEQIKPLFSPSALTSGNTRSQNQAAIFHPNGAMFFSWWKSFAELGSFYKGKTGAVIMEPKESVDIDSEDDFQYAEFLMKRR